MDIPTLDFILEKIYSRATQGFLKKEYPEFLLFLLENFPEELTINERLFWYYHNLKTYPVCKMCGKRVNFNGLRKGYRDFCSLKCSRNHPDTIEKLKQTNIKKYGYEFNAQNPEIKEKMKQTNIKKYGYKCSLQNNIIQEKSKKTKLEKYGDEKYTNTSKMISTNLQKYGVISTMSIDSVREKSKKTKLEKYGNEKYTNRKKATFTNNLLYGGNTPFHSKEVQHKAYITKINNFKNQNDWLRGYEYDDSNRLIYICNCPHAECDKCREKCFKILAQQYDIRRYNNIELCTRLLPIQHDKIKGTYIELFIQNILNEYNINYITNIRSIISPKELDIYIPSKQIAIECNGIYWHSNKNSIYHKDKFNECEKSGIQLLTLWEDWIKNKPEIIKNIILSKLNIYNEILYARKCYIKEIDSVTAKDFLNQNHLQGYIPSSIKIGLYFQNDLISIMTFGKRRKIMNQKNKDDNYEMYRYCVKSGYKILGGASKLLNYFIKKYKPIQIESYSSNDISNGNLYKTLGFQCVSETLSYWYIEKNMNRIHRFKYNNIENKNDLIKIYDSGVKK